MKRERQRERVSPLFSRTVSSQTSTSTNSLPAKLQNNTTTPYKITQDATVLDLNPPSPPPPPPPSLSTHTPKPTHPPMPALTFSRIIEADHDTIQQLAQKITSRNTNHSQRLSLLPRLTAHLIRHDISEDLVMRPALARYLGVEGARAAAQDRLDHTDLKVQLVALLGDEELLKEEGEERLRGTLHGLAKEMARHMEEESGRWIPMLEKCVGYEGSVKLGREYLRTLVLTVDVQVAGEDGVWRRCFEGLEEYARAEVDVFRDILSGLERRYAEGAGGGCLEERVRRKMVEIGLVFGSGVGGDVLRGHGLGLNERSVNGKL